jgi:hypothetical protein
MSNKDKIPFLGIGNVCTKYKGTGTGKILMKEVNKYLLSTNNQGMLFCKNDLVSFYIRNNWKLIKNLHPDLMVNTMVFNFKEDVNTLKYNERLF